MKVTLKKFNDSLNAKITKLQSLLKDLEDNFDGKDIEQTVTSLTKHIQCLEHHYEASCSSAVRVARDLVSDVGEAAAARSGGLLQLARSSTSNAERDSRKVLVKRCRLSLEPFVPLSELKCGEQKVTVLRLKTWMQFLVDKRLFHIVPGLIRRDEARQEAILAQFWTNYKISHPKHPVFELERQGRATWPKKVYEDDRTFDKLLGLCKKDSDFMLHHGVSDPKTGKQYFAAILSVVGDWQWLVKAGKLTRNYNHVVKKPQDIEEPQGICHLCQAGQKEHSFEQLQTRSPSWLQTIGQQDPFEQPSPLSTLPHEPGAAASLFKYDVWHTCHLGVCKAFIGAALALLSDLYRGRSKDTRFEQLNRDFMEWCKRKHRQPLITKLTKDTIGWDNNANFPVASWYKGSLSTTFCEFIEDMTRGQQFEDQLLTKTGEAVQSLNIFLKGLYKSDVFLTSEHACYLGEQGLRFLRRYSWCATESVRQQRCLFLILPKAHCLHHICLKDLVLDSRQYSKVVNPIIYSVQMLEDYVGRNARLSRRIHPASVTKRVVQRHLQQAYAKYKEIGYLE
ncbi:unnamed protein product [Symbiodinium sp. KB8]|nr:unnamed protein product [Symbiodinium sp. KB8]